MTAPISLLPSNSTPWERAQSLTSAERRPTPTEIVRSIWNPETCPVELLPYLAWGLGLEIWKDDWSEHKKRDVVSRIWQLKRRKTTLQGIRDYTNLVGGDVVKAVRPKDKMWWVPSMTDSERTALMKRMPEIRVFPSPPTAIADHEKPFLQWSFWNACVWWPSDADYRWLDRAVYIENGVETRVALRGIEGPLDASYRIGLQGTSVLKSFYGPEQFAPLSFRIPSDAADKILSITPLTEGLNFAVPPGLVAASVRPEPVAETVQAPVYKAFHWPSFFNASYRIPSDAPLHLYSSLRLMDPTRIGKFGKPMSFWGWSRSGIAAFSAELTIKVPTQKPVWKFENFWGQGFWAAQDLSQMWDSLEAVTVSQAARDDINVSLQLYQEIDFSGGLRFGEFNFGDYRKVA